MKPRKGDFREGRIPPPPPLLQEPRSLHLRLSFRKSVSIYPKSAPDVHVLFSFTISARPPCHTWSVHKATWFTSPPNRPNHSRYGELLIFTRCLFGFPQVKHSYDQCVFTAYLGIACSRLSRLSDSGEDAKEKGTRKVGGAGERKSRPRSPQFPPVFFFVFALSQFSGPDYLGAWNRLILGNQTYHSAPLGAWVFLGSQK